MSMRSVQRWMSAGWRAVALLAFCVWTLFPILWTLSISLRTEVDALAMPPKWIFLPTLNSYSLVLAKARFAGYFANSVIITLSATFLSLVVGVPAAYVLARYQFSRRKDIDFWFLGSRMAPPVAAIIPYFVLARSLRLMDTRIAVVLVYLTIGLPLVVWVMKGFFLEVPQELEDAAMVDGCGRFGTFARVSLPLVAPGMGAAAILCFLFMWSELMFALVLTESKAKTAAVGMMQFMGFHEIMWSQLSAAAMLLLIPSIIFIALAQRSLVRGLTSGAVK
jgi:multiple sugar transport system permease protein